MWKCILLVGENMGGDEFQKSEQNPFFALKDNFVAHHNQAREKLFQKLVAQFNEINLLHRFCEIKHECHFHEGSTLSRVDADITFDRFTTQLNDAGFYVNFYYTNTKKEDNSGQFFQNRNSSQQSNKETFEYNFLIYWNFNHSIQSILKGNQFLKKNPSYVLDSTESEANLFIENRNKFVHEQVNLRINFEQSLTDELLNSVSASGKQKTGDVEVDSNLFAPMLYFRRGYHVGSDLSTHDAKLSDKPLISNSLKPAHSSSPFVKFSSDGFSICGNRVPFLGQNQVKSYSKFAVSGMKALYLNTTDNTVFILDLAPRLKELGKEKPAISEIYQSIEPSFRKIKGLPDLNPQSMSKLKFSAQENGESFIISCVDDDLFYYNISSEPVKLRDTILANEADNYRYLFHPSKKQFLSTQILSPNRKQRYNPYSGNITHGLTRLLKFNKNKVTLVDDIFRDQTMEPVFSKGGDIILSMSNGSIRRHVNGESSPTAGAYGNAKTFSFSSDKKYLYLTYRQPNQPNIQYILNESGELIKLFNDVLITKMEFCSGEPEIEEAIKRVMTMVEQAGISIQMEGNSSFRMTWNWDV